MKLKQNTKPNLKFTPMICDVALDEKLSKYELTKFLNAHTCNCFLGRPQSGKTTLLNEFFSNNELLKNVFHDIYLFQPSHSRTSMKKNIWEKGIRDNHKFDELTIENLSSVMAEIKSQEKSVASCIIFDDVGSYLRSNNALITMLKDMMANHRHIGLSMYFCVQTIKMIPFELRRIMDNLFVFNCSKETLHTIFEEYLEMENKKIIETIAKMVYDEPHNFLFINVPSQRLFKNWDEILMEG